MVYTTPRTWVTDEVVNAAIMNTHVRDNFDAIAPDGATSASWTPVIGGSGGSETTDPADMGRQYRIGPLQFAWAYWLDFNILSPLAGALGTLDLALPEATSVIAAEVSAGQVIGTWRLLDASAPSSSVSGLVYLRSSASARFALASGASLSNTTITAAAPDKFSLSLCYPVA